MKRQLTVCDYCKRTSDEVVVYSVNLETKMTYDDYTSGAWERGFQRVEDCLYTFDICTECMNSATGKIKAELDHTVTPKKTYFYEEEQ